MCMFHSASCLNIVVLAVLMCTLNLMAFAGVYVLTWGKTGRLYITHLVYGKDLISKCREEPSLYKSHHQ